MTSHATSSFRALAALAVAALALLVVGSAAADRGKPLPKGSEAPAAVAASPTKAGKPRLRSSEARKARVAALQGRLVRVLVQAAATKAAVELCRSERDELGEADFADAYGDGKAGVAGCVTETRAEVAPLAREAGDTCRPGAADAAAFKSCVADEIAAALDAQDAAADPAADDSVDGADDDVDDGEQNNVDADGDEDDLE